MCKSKFHGGPHCDENPEKRRTRQRLGYHVNKVSNDSSTVLLPVVEERPIQVPVLVAEVIITKKNTVNNDSNVSNDTLNSVVMLDDATDNRKIASGLAREEELSQPEAIKDLAEGINKRLNNAGTTEEFFLNGKEYSEKNLQDGITEREKEITYVGSLLATRADEIAGITPMQARAEWESRVIESRVTFDKVVAEYEQSSKEFSKSRDEIRSKYRMGNSLSPMSAEDEEKMAVLRRANNAEFDRVEAIKVQHGILAQGFDEQSQALLARLSDGNMKAIAEFRELGGKIQVTDNSSKRAVGVLNEYVSPIIPKQWLENDSKNSDPIRVKDTVGRAHFSHGTEQESRQVVPSEVSRSLAPGVDIDSNDETFRGWRKTGETRKDGSVVWRGPEFETLNSRDYPVEGYKPKGRGWEVRQVENMNMGSPKYVKAWVRAKNTSVVKATTSQPELLVPKITSKQRDANEKFANNRMISIARHEAIHGIAERSNPHIVTLEEKFVQRRTTDAHGKRDKLEKYNGHSNEKTRPDNFVSAYMGKQYSGKAAEVLTTGTEALFNGRFGGLAGIGEKRSDPDMRNFVLGLYVSA